MKKALIGSGGHAKEVMSQMGEILPCFVSDNLVDKNSLPLSSLDISKYELMIAISNPVDRHNIAQILPQNTKFFSFIHPTALLMNNNIIIDIGSFIGAYSIITTNVVIGKHCILNRSVQIGHDAIIGDYFSAMPGSVVSGGCKLGDFVYLGTNSSIREKLIIYDKVNIGLNTGVVKSISESGTYAGNPAQKIK